MRKCSRAFILIGWFFAFQFPSPMTEGVVVKAVVGEFKSENQCEAEKLAVEDSDVATIAGFQISKKCIERKAA